MANATYADNPSFVLRAIEEVTFEQRPIPESEFGGHLATQINRQS